MKRFLLACATLFATAILIPGITTANDILTDRCSAEVSFPPSYSGRPNAKDAYILKRKADGTTDPIEFKVATDGSGHIRWWCHSTTGNDFDLGTWRFNPNPAAIAECGVAVGSTVASEGSAAPTLAACAQLVKPGASAWQGWTPEQSRCNDHSTRIRVRLGPDRLLETVCLGK